MILPAAAMLARRICSAPSSLEHVHDPITATVLADPNDKMIWVSLDVSGVQADLARQILDKTAAKGVTLEPEEIILGPPYAADPCGQLL
ncbi:MAG: hypothetical protein ACLSA6_04575 [Holdemania massiliensis]